MGRCMSESKSSRELIDVYVHYNDYSIGPVEVEPLGNDLYKIWYLDPFLDDPKYGSTVRASRPELKKIEVIEIIDRGEWKSVGFCWTKEVLEGKAFQALVKKWESIGVIWERYFGGIVVLAYPRSLEFDPNPELKLLGFKGEADGPPSDEE